MSETVLAIEITVDDQKYGPFPKAKKAEFQHLLGMKGVEVREFWILSDSLIPPPEKVMRRRDRSTPLLAGVPTIPTLTSSRARLEGE